VGGIMDILSNIFASKRFPSIFNKVDSELINVTGTTAVGTYTVAYTYTPPYSVTYIGTNFSGRDLYYAILATATNFYTVFNLYRDNFGGMNFLTTSSNVTESGLTGTWKLLTNSSNTSNVGYYFFGLFVRIA
jgi:hypothetical protein